MLGFLAKVWGLARPYRWRLFLGVLTGVISGLIEPLMIAMVTVSAGDPFVSGSEQNLRNCRIKVWFVAGGSD